MSCVIDKGRRLFNGETDWSDEFDRRFERDRDRMAPLRERRNTRLGLAARFVDILAGGGS